MVKVVAEGIVEKKTRGSTLVGSINREGGEDGRGSRSSYFGWKRRLGKRRVWLVLETKI